MGFTLLSLCKCEFTGPEICKNNCNGFHFQFSSQNFPGLGKEGSRATFHGFGNAEWPHHSCSSTVTLLSYEGICGSPRVECNLFLRFSIFEFFVEQSIVSYVLTLKSCKVWVKSFRRQLTGNQHLLDRWFLLLLPPLPPVFCIQNVRYFLLKYKPMHTLDKNFFNPSIHLFIHSSEIN